MEHILQAGTLLKVKEDGADNQAEITDMKWDSSGETKTYSHSGYEEFSEEKSRQKEAFLLDAETETRGPIDHMQIVRKCER